MYDPKTSGDIRSAIFSPASEAGLTPFGLPDGPTTDLFGRVPAPAKVSPRRGKAKASTIPVTSGHLGTRLFGSYVLQRFLVNKLTRRFPTGGSILWRLTWKLKATPSGRQYCLLRALAHRTDDTVFGLWPTVMANDGTSVPYFNKRTRVDGTTAVSLKLPGAAKLAGWPTPSATSATGGGQAKRAMGETRHGSNIRDFVMLSHWPTACSQDGPNGGPSQGSNRLPGAAALSSWATPSARDHKDTPGMATTGPNGRSRLDQLPRQAHLTASPPSKDSGKTSNGSTARTASTGQLNPDFVLWLMGYPREWLSCGVSETPSSRKSGRSS